MTIPLYFGPSVVITTVFHSIASTFPASCPSLDLTFLWIIASQSDTASSDILYSTYKYDAMLLMNCYFSVAWPNTVYSLHDSHRMER